VSDLDKHNKSENKVTITLWGTGAPYREFLYVDDLADACVYVMLNVRFDDVKSQNDIKKVIKNTHINIGTGKDITIMELSDLISRITGFNGPIKWDNSKPDGTFRKKLDVTRLENLGWKYKYKLEYGIRQVYNSLIIH
jgi:GDP-L-fucose synthase